MNLKMPSKDTFGFSDHVMRFCVLVGENIEDYKELTYKKAFPGCQLEGRLFSTRTMSKTSRVQR